MKWLEVSITVTGEQAEAVADVMARFSPNGVTTEQAVDFIDAEDEGTPIGPITVCAYLPVNSHLREKVQKLEESLHYLAMIQPLPPPVYKPLADQNWMDAWKTRYQPIPIGRKLIIVPPWLESPEPSRIPLRIDPGMAFGTGTHPSTQLCLELIEEQYYAKALLEKEQIVCAMQMPSSVIDIGCGSGILSISAIKLGADFTLGVDIDQASIKASRENAEANGISSDQFVVGLGSVSEILSGKFGVPLRFGGGEIYNAPLVLANLLTSIILRLFDQGLTRIVSPGGKLVLSGILADQESSVISSLNKYGLKFKERRQAGDWVALLVNKNS